MSDETTEKKEYPRPSLTADNVVIALGEEPGVLRVLFVRRARDPFAGAWAFPGGFVEPTETVAQAAARELQEETALRDVRLVELGCFSRPGRGLLRELAGGGLRHRLGRLDEAAGERPPALEGIAGAADHEHAVAAPGTARDHDHVGGEGRAGVVLLVFAHRSTSAAVERRTPAAAISARASRVPSGVMPATASVSSVVR